MSDDDEKILPDPDLSTASVEELITELTKRNAGDFVFIRHIPEKDEDIEYSIYWGKTSLHAALGLVRYAFSRIRSRMK